MQALCSRINRDEDKPAVLILSDTEVRKEIGSLSQFAVTEWIVRCTSAARPNGKREKASRARCEVESR